MHASTKGFSEVPVKWPHESASCGFHCSTDAARLDKEIAQRKKRNTQPRANAHSHTHNTPSVLFNLCSLGISGCPVGGWPTVRRSEEAAAVKFGKIQAVCRLVLTSAPECLDGEGFMDESGDAYVFATLPASPRPKRHYMKELEAQKKAANKGRPGPSSGFQIMIDIWPRRQK